MITIIIPTYKPQQYVLHLLKSLVDQDIDKDAFEVLLILNGDKDPYWSQLTEYIHSSNLRNCRLMYSDKVGVSYARNLAIDLAKGDYIVFIDDDDLVSPNYLSSLRSKVQDRSICVSNEKIFINSIDELGDGYVTKAFTKAMKSTDHSLLKMRSFLSSACFKIIPRNVIGNRRFNLNFKTGEDALFMASISDRIDQICLSSEDTIYYRRAREGSASRKKQPFIAKLNNSFSLFFTYLKLYISNPTKYNFTFFFTRFIAVFKAIL